MAYSADTFVADEQPTTAKWNKLWSNDASFNDGTGILDSAILTRHLATGNVTLPKLDLSSMGIISSTTTTSNFSAATDIDSLSYAIPAGCTKVYIWGTARLQAQNGTTQDMTCWVDYNAAASVTKSFYFTATGSFQGANVALLDSLTVAGGTTKTFKLRATTSGGGLANVGNRTVFIIPAYA